MEVDSSSDVARLLRQHDPVEAGGESNPSSIDAEFRDDALDPDADRVQAGLVVPEEPG